MIAVMLLVVMLLLLRLVMLLLLLMVVVVLLLLLLVMLLLLVVLVVRRLRLRLLQRCRLGLTPAKGDGARPVRAFLHQRLVELAAGPRVNRRPAVLAVVLEIPRGITC